VVVAPTSDPETTVTRSERLLYNWGTGGFGIAAENTEIALTFGIIVHSCFKYDTVSNFIVILIAIRNFLYTLAYCREMYAFRLRV